MSDTFSLAIPPNFRELLAARSGASPMPGISRRAFLEEARRVIDEELTRCDAFSQFMREELRPARAREEVDQDLAFAAYLHRALLLGEEPPERLTYAAFVGALDRAGLASRIDDDGRAFRVGWQLENKFWGSVSAYAPADVAEFIESRCATGPEMASKRVKSQHLYDAYRAYANSCGRTPVSQNKFGKALKFLGFRKVISNGVWVVGLALRDEEPSGLEGPDHA